jgi:hypothetical protein
VPEFLPFVNLGALGVLVALLYYAFRIVTRGDVIPRPTVDALLAARDAEIIRSNERADAWHRAYESERHVSEVTREQNRELIEVARTVEHVLESLQLVAERRYPDAPAAS